MNADYLKEQLLLLAESLNRKPTRYDLGQAGLPNANTFRKLGISLGGSWIQEHLYRLNPRVCVCGQELNRAQPRYCSSSCSARTNNTKRGRRTMNCLNCGSVRPNRRGKYCSSSCATNHQWVSTTVPRILSGLVSERPTLKKYLLQTIGAVCSSCRNTDWLGGPIPLELDHIDGDASNNMVSNIRLLCPNCHALQPTSKGKNRGKGRKSRGLRL